MQRSLFESDAIPYVFRPFIRDSNICIDISGKQRQKKRIPVINTIHSNSSDTSIYERWPTCREDGKTTRSERVCFSREKPHKINVELKTFPQRTSPRRNALKSTPLQPLSNQESSKTKISARKCICNKPLPQARAWKYKDPENLIRIEPTRYYVILPPSGRRTKEHSNTVPTQGSNKSETPRKHLLHTEQRKLCPKCKHPKKPFLKSTDCDILFGHGKLPHPSDCGWNKTRLDWMIDLERRQELRRKRQQLCKAAIAEENEMDLCCFPFLRNVFVWHF